MIKKYPLLPLLLFLVACTGDGDPGLELSDQAYLLYNTRLINVSDGSLTPDQAILIDSGRIRAVGSYMSLEKTVPEERRVNGSSRYLLPGLWDMHVHIEGEDLVADNKALLPLYLAHGITTIRDCASDLGGQVLAWRDEINAGDLFGPRIFTAGRKLEGINSIWKGDLEIANEAELRESLDLLDEYGVDFVKITENTLSGDLFLAAVKAAHARGYKVSGHVPIDLRMEELAAAGFSSIEHASYLLRLGSNQGEKVDSLRAGSLSAQQAELDYLDHFDQASANAAYARLAETGIYVTPTLIGGKQLAYLDENNHQNDAFLQYLTERFTSKYQWRIDRMVGETPTQRERRKYRYQLIARQLPYLQQAGIPLLAGSDAAALNTYVYPAMSLHEELVLFQDAGLTPLQILQSATVNGARFMGRLDELGTITPGKIADLLLLNSNPLEDIRATQDIFAVVCRGQYLDRRALNGLLEEAKAAKVALDSSRK